MKNRIKDNKERTRFELKIDNSTAFIEYIINNKGIIFLTHTEVPKKIEGRGIAFEIIEEVLKNVKSRDLKVVPLCPIVATYIRKHPEWKEILSENIHV